MDERKMSQKQRNYLQMLRRRKRRIAVLQVLIFVLFLLIWESAVRLSWIDGFIFSSPSRVVKTFVGMCEDGSIAMHTASTLLETIVSFFACRSDRNRTCSYIMVFYGAF